MTVRCPVDSGSPISSMSMSMLHLFLPPAAPLSGEGDGVRSGEAAADLLRLLLLELCLEPTTDSETDPERLRAEVSSFLPSLSLNPSASLRPSNAEVKLPRSRNGILTAFAAALTISRLSDKTASFAFSKMRVHARRASFLSASSACKKSNLPTKK